MVLMSATMPAPPDGSIPAMVSTTGLSCWIERIEQPDSRDAACACRETTLRITERDAADCYHGKALQFTCNLLEFIQPLRWAIDALRFSFEDGAEHGKVCAAVA